MEMLFIVYLLLATEQFSDARTQWNSPALRNLFTPTPMETLVRNYEYPVEEHSVETADGFKLGVFRIPKGRSSSTDKGSSSAKRPPVIVQHGFLMSSSCFAVKPPPDGLAYMLADAGYDVWLSNSRGTHYSRNHTRLHPGFGFEHLAETKAYYDYSFNELGYYDLPAVIDYVLEKTNSSDVSYIGHSQGTSLLLAMGADRPEYNKKIRIAAALAPVAYMNDIRGFNYFLKMPSELFYTMVREWGFKESLFSDQHLMAASLEGCKLPILRRSCYFFMEFFSGFDSSQYDSSLMSAIFDQGLSTVSLKEIQHYHQIARSGNFIHFNYGFARNLELYGQIDPPPYDLSRVTMPIRLYYAENDFISGVKDVARLQSELPNSKLIRINYTNFNHLDYMWGKDTRQLLYNSLIRDLKAHL